VQNVTSPPFRIFLNYRREDTEDAAGRLYDLLAEEFQEDNVFMDVDKIPEGVPFADYISEAVARADVFVAVIGRGWLEARDKNGRLRLDDESDFVRLEIEAALDRGITVIPAFVQSAKPPTASDLPKSLERLAGIQGRTLSADRWAYDSGRLVERLKEIQSERTPPPTTPLTTADDDAADAADVFDTADDGRPSRWQRLLNRFSRRWILILGGVGVVAALAIALWVFWPNLEPDDQTTTPDGQTATLPFEDDFSSDEYDWPNVAEGQVGGRYTNDAYQILAQKAPNQLGVVASPTNAPTAENVRIDVEAEATDGSAVTLGYGYGYGIVCMASDDLDDFYRFTVWPNGLSIHKVVDGDPDLLRDIRLATPAGVKMLQARCVTAPGGGAVDLDFVVNEEASIHYSDDEEPIETGAVGLHAVLGGKIEFGGTVDVRFEDFAASEG
jgi:hypothetical protein